ncbi:hypothetical protein BJ878DRAFT_436828 [Calycina marina]|uniref:UBX domain-containing protein n=1 Tax=Calycina marina TaxID=1763456 RepID=A0A9P8CGX2_9HELO|nr:hypothetical protein BJ878DRAFT_436828 [Calycina marina]
MDEAVGTFTAFTGSSPEIGRRYLGMTDGNAEQAIQLFFDSPDLASGISEPALQSNPPPIPSSTRPTHIIDSDDEEMHDTGSANGSTSAAVVGRAAAVEDDEAIARRLQEEMYTGGDSGGRFGDDGVRAPLARTTETLVGGPNMGYGHGDIDDEVVMDQIRARQYARRGGRGPVGVFNQRQVPSIWDSSDPNAHRQGMAHATGGASEQSSKAARLAELFRPPFELMSHLSWDSNREEGKAQEKWLLVNVQDPSIFDCQQLNRDIWKDDGIKEIIKEHFIFMQYSTDDPRGASYIQYYFQSQKESDASYPHIAIVDPRTGEQLKTWSGRPIPKAGEFLMQLVEFLDRYSFDMSKKNPVARKKAEKPKAVDVDRLTEEEMLDLALQNSLAKSPIQVKADDPDEMTESFVDEVKGKGKAVEQVEEVAAGSSSSFLNISSTNPHTEPANLGPNVTRIQFRHSEGRIVRKFEVTDPVCRMYEWLKAEPIPGKVGITFELIDRGKNLIEHLDQTIEEAGLKQSTVMVEFMED